MEIIRTRTQAVELFGSQAALGRALNITRSAINQWKEILNQRQIDEITGAAIRLNLLECSKPRRTNTAA